MSTNIIFMFAIGVFVLMGVGIALTMVEFNRISEDPSQRKGAGSGTARPNAIKQSQIPHPAPSAPAAKRGGRANIRIVH